LVSYNWWMGNVEKDFVAVKKAKQPVMGKEFTVKSKDGKVKNV